MSGKQPLRYRWRDAIMASELPSTARHVAHVLTAHMNDEGRWLPIKNADRAHMNDEGRWLPIKNADRLVVVVAAKCDE